MNTNATTGNTTKFRLIAKEVVADQERVCAVQMKNIEDKLDGVVEDVSAVKKDVGTIKTEIAVLKVRLAIGAVVVASLPMIVDLIRGLIRGLIAK